MRPLLFRYSHIAFLGALFLAACASNEHPEGTSYAGDIPGTWTSPADTQAVDPEWWTRFGDDELIALIEAATAINPSVGQAEARAEQARAQALISGADRLPQVSGAFNASRQKQSAAGFGPVAGGDSLTSFETESYGLSLNVNWEIDLWGRIARQTAAATQEYLASTDNLQATRQSIAAQTAKSYFAVIEARQQVELSRRTVDNLAETARQIGNRTDAGIAAPTDKQLSITNLETAKAGLQQREDALQRATRQLELIVRQYPSGDIDVPDALPAIPAAPAAGLPADLLARRPDLRAAERNLFAAGLRTSAARRAFLPAITLTGSTGTQSSELGDLLDGDFSVWSIAGQIVQPIFQGGRLRANVTLNKAIQTEAAEAYAQIALQAFSEVETALTADINIRQREAALLRAADAAADAERIAFNRYQQGITPFLTVLESQQRALDTRSAYLTARRARLDNRIDLHLALGGGFAATEDTGATETVD